MHEFAICVQQRLQVLLVIFKTNCALSFKLKERYISLVVCVTMANHGSELQSGLGVILSSDPSSGSAECRQCPGHPQLCIAECPHLTQADVKWFYS